MVKVNLFLLLFVILLSFVVSPNVVVKRDPTANTYVDSLLRATVFGVVFAISYGYIIRLSKCI